MKPRTIAICGNGAGAALLLFALARFNDGPMTVIVIGTGKGRCGAGVAYSTTNPDHLLNAPAGRMSAEASAPLQFKQWLERRAICVEDFAAQFVSRSLYAEYLDELLEERLQRAPGFDVRFVHAQVHNLTQCDSGWTVIYECGSVFADLVVLATGNDMPAPLGPLYKDVAPKIIDIPWGPLLVAPQEDVLILGTGLTAMDAVVTLANQNHHGTIHLLSRRGLCPARHVLPAPGKKMPHPFPSTVRGFLSAIRQVVGRKPSSDEWQGFMDSMRPFWPEIWQSFSLQERERFLRHGMTYWSVHRHRLAPTMGDMFETALRSNVKILKGRLSGLARSGSRSIRAEITYRGKMRSLSVERIINCTGPNSDPTKSCCPLIQNIITAHHARVGSANLGLDVDVKNQVIDTNGKPQANLFAMGALTRGRWWEITAIPEISRQAAEIAGHLRAAMASLDAPTRVRTMPIE